MACPDFDMVWKTKKPAARVIKIAGASPREVTPGSPNVHVEKGVTAEHVVLSRTSAKVNTITGRPWGLTSDLITQMVGRVPGQMDGSRAQVTNTKSFIVVKEFVENTMTLLTWHVVSLTE